MKQFAITAVGLLLTATFALAGPLDIAVVEVRPVQIGSGPGNSPPSPVDDFVSTTWETAVEIPLASLLSNDTDPDGDTLKVVSVGQPTHGSLALAGAGKVAYIPPNGCTINQDTFGYTVSDGTARASATVHVAIGGIVCPPKPPNS